MLQLSRKSKQRRIAQISLIACLWLPTGVAAHNSPADLAQMSLEDLMQVRVDDLAIADKNWEFSLKTVRRVQDGLLAGSHNISVEEVLWDGVEPRTQRNFPIVGFRIEQQAEQFSVSRRFDDGFRISTSISYLEQSTDHVSIVDNYEQFTITTSGISDWQWQVSKSYRRKVYQGLDISLGVSLPTGSISEKGDTPRAPGNQVVPYNMQLGSGTYDFPLAIAWRDRFWDCAWGLSADYRIRTGENDRGYRLGNISSVKAWGSYRFSEMTVSLLVGYQRRFAIQGMDESLIVDNPNGFIYPVTKANPAFYGGEKTTAQIGLSRQLKWRDAYVDIDGSYTVILREHVNGIQPKEQNRYELGLRYHF